ncbi:hypothetical protein [Xenorhabdus bovienii]|uniref:Uncharacterized protein n=1 Tax=Xenorhabdus bovienii str. kraussei Becker Underwood TaxID=1398204 RepID=A0A077PIE8_XENBV|nr:hypothetical protein [Xenorhabdus bovienii]CDH24120.1 conserved exported hypothetical protein [Xenorhabdus bovienii str. kraussei Becker Underwood]
MKTFNLYILAAAITVVSSNVLAADKYVDPIQNKIDEQHSILVKKYQKTCKARNRISCQFEAQDRAEEDIPSRGSVAYSKKNYASYTSAQAKEKLKELVSIYDKLDGQSKSSWDGKLTQINIESEIRWLMSHKLGQSAPDIYSAKLYLGLPLR